MGIRDQIHDNALAVILEANPQLITECEVASEAELCGSTRGQYRYLLLSEALEKQAKRHRMHVWDYQLKLAEDAGIDVSDVRAEDRRATAAALGMDDLI
ncbi:hypothetical protein FEM54_05300 [Pseudomonas edaphica]|uniref:Uncharacterized protein n=1 Tax=Pseudomonas edaphica TaxID=2006980 RepID=A0ABY2U9F2_9PSED|nr:DUF6388 family protein [Pseudomonas edaphica]TLG93153.1 hypothetical protein FEM54_05300 [Pseudomonas edaphica]